jgi:hypothetical protein
MRRLNEIGDSDLEQLLAGKGPSGSGKLDGLAYFVSAAKRASSIPPSPATEQRHISEIVRTAQLNAEKGEPVVRPGSKALGPANQVSGLPKRRRKLAMESLLTPLVAKIVAIVMALASAVTTGALAAEGNLPPDIQEKISDLAGDLGIDIPSGDDLVSDAGDEVGDLEDEVGDDVSDVTDDDGEGDDAEGTDEGEDGTESDGDGDKVQGGDPNAGKRSNFDVHEAIASTEPGPERGKAVSEAARQKPADEPGGEEDGGEDDVEDDDTTSEDDSGAGNGGPKGNAFGHDKQSNR